MFKDVLIKELKSAIDRIERDECGMTETEAMQMLAMLTHEAMSKEQVLVYLGWSRSKFDDYCAKGLMPKGRKRSGWKELCWYKDELNDALVVLRNKYGHE